MSRRISERRKHERIALRLQVQVGGVAGAAIDGGFTQNISSGGFYFVSPEPLLPGENIDVFLALPACSEADRNAGIDCRVRVMRVDPLDDGTGFGLACRIERYTVAAIERKSLAWRNYA